MNEVQAEKIMRAKIRLGSTPACILRVIDPSVREASGRILLKWLRDGDVVLCTDGKIRFKKDHE